MTTDGTDGLKELRAAKTELQRQYREDEHPGWIECASGSYKQMMVNAIYRRIEFPHHFTEEQLEAACLALNITQLP